MKKVLIGVVVFFVLLFVGRNFIISSAIKIGAKVGAGSHVDIGKLDCDLLGTSFGVWDFDLYYPESVADSIMTSVGEVYFDYQIKPFLKNKELIIDEARLHVKEAVIVIDPSGYSFTPSIPFFGKDNKPKKDKEASKMTIAKLSVKIDKFTVKKYNKDGKPSVSEYNINLSQTSENVTDPTMMVMSMMTMASAKVGIQGVFDVGGASVDLATDLTKGTVDLGVNTVKGAGSLLKGILGDKK